jgi:hypothetical protein
LEVAAAPSPARRHAGHPWSSRSGPWRRVGAVVEALAHNLVRCRGTLSWLAIISATRLVLRGADPRLQHRLLESVSTNLSHLAHDPLNVLLTSICFVTSTPDYLAFVVMAAAVSAPVERWLGLRRWLIAVAIGHIGATLVIAIGLKIGIAEGWIDPQVRHALDVGVSYAVRSLAGVLFFAIGVRWRRWAYLSAVAVATAAPLLAGPDFTDAGHAVALVLGLVVGASWGRSRRPLRLADLRSRVVAPR